MEWTIPLVESANTFIGYSYLRPFNEQRRIRRELDDEKNVLTPNRVSIAIRQRGSEDLIQTDQLLFAPRFRRGARDPSTRSEPRNSFPE